MIFVVVFTIFVVFSGIVAGSIKKFELNHIPLSKKQKMLFPLITVILLLLHFQQFVLYFNSKRELSMKHLKFMSVSLPIAFGCLIEVVLINDIEINSSNWVQPYKYTINKLMLNQIGT